MAGSSDLIHLQIRADEADQKWKPTHLFNLTGDRTIPFSTYAKFVVDTATSLGQGGDKGFFKSQAQTHIAHALELLAELRQPVTLAGCVRVAFQQGNAGGRTGKSGDLMLQTPRRTGLHEHFKNRFLNQPERTAWRRS